MYAIAWPWVLGAAGITATVFGGLFFAAMFRAAGEADAAQADADRFNLDDAPRIHEPGRFDGVAYLHDYRELKRVEGRR